MVSKIKRLPPGERFYKGNVLKGTVLMVKVKNTQRGTFRIGFVISKKIDKRATVRNRIRRILSDEIQSMDPKILVGCDILCIVTKPVGENEKALREEFAKLLLQINR